MKTESITIGKGKSGIELFYIQLAPNIFLIEDNILLVFLKTKLGTGKTALPVKSKSFKYDRNTMLEIKGRFTSLYEEKNRSKKKSAG